MDLDSFDLPLPKSCVELRTTDADVDKEIDRLRSVTEALRFAFFSI